MANYRLLADLVVVFHAAYVGFVVLGFAAILIGLAMGWRWVRNPAFRVTHLAAIGFVVVQVVAGMICPLTSLEDFLRVKGGGAPYPGGFIAYWARELIYHDLPSWVFTAVYLAFGALVAAVFILAPPRLPGRRGES